MRVPLWTNGRDLSVACGERSRSKAREPVKDVRRAAADWLASDFPTTSFRDTGGEIEFHCGFARGDCARGAEDAAHQPPHGDG